jgi:DNA ligase-1
MIPVGFKPNLAATLTKPELINFPVYASPKIDGIRCTVFDGIAYSRSLKPIPNDDVQAWAAINSDVLETLDGELVVGSATASDCMQKSMGVMRKSGILDFYFHVFDVADPTRPYYARTEALRSSGRAWIFVSSLRGRLVPQTRIDGPEELAALEAVFLAQGYEGMMIRSPDAPYKFGRSTEREGGLTKVKRFTDAEALIIGFEEEMHNGNEATKDAFGRSERSTNAAGLVGKNTLGALRVRNSAGIEFNIGTGFTAKERESFWYLKDDLLGKTVTYKSFEHGVKDLPRHPVFKAFRSLEDMSS